MFPDTEVIFQILLYFKYSSQKMKWNIGPKYCKKVEKKIDCDTFPLTGFREGFGHSFFLTCTFIFRRVIQIIDFIDLVMHQKITCIGETVEL